MSKKIEMMLNTREMYYWTECSRCGGSGSYSYCQMYGTVCFGCNGRKFTRTSRGSSILKAWTDYALAELSDKVLVTDLAVGDKVYMGSDGWRTVVGVDEKPDRFGWFGFQRKGNKTQHMYSETTSIHRLDPLKAPKKGEMFEGVEFPRPADARIVQRHTRGAFLSPTFLRERPSTDDTREES